MIKRFAEEVSIQIGDEGELTDRALLATEFVLRTEVRDGETQDKWIARGVKDWQEIEILMRG